MQGGLSHVTHIIFCWWTQTMISFHSERNTIKVSVDQIHFVIHWMIYLKICPKLINDNNDSGDSDDCSIHLTVAPDNKKIMRYVVPVRFAREVFDILTIHMTWTVTPIDDLTTCIQKHLNWDRKNGRPDWYNMSKVTVCHMWRPIL